MFRSLFASSCLILLLYQWPWNGPGTNLGSGGSSWNERAWSECRVRTISELENGDSPWSIIDRLGTNLDLGLACLCLDRKRRWAESEPVLGPNIVSVQWTWTELGFGCLYSEANLWMGSSLKLVRFGYDSWCSKLKDRYKGSCSKRTWNEFVYVSSWNERAWSERVIRLKELETEMETKGNERSVGFAFWVCNQQEMNLTITSKTHRSEGHRREHLKWTWDSLPVDTNSHLASNMFATGIGLDS